MEVSSKKAPRKRGFSVLDGGMSALFKVPGRFPAGWPGTQAAQPVYNDPKKSIYPRRTRSFTKKIETLSRQDG